MKKLVTWFSASGITENAAKRIAEQEGADLYEIAPKEKYTAADLDWRDKESRSTKEMTDPASRPELKEAVPDLSAYDTVYIGFPIWWGVAPHVVNTFIEAADLAGKRVVLYATSGGSGIEKALEDMKAKYPTLNWDCIGLQKFPIG